MPAEDAALRLGSIARRYEVSMKTITMSLEEYQKDIADAKVSGKEEFFRKDLSTLLSEIALYHHKQHYPPDSFGHRQLEECAKLSKALDEYRKVNLMLRY
jgi:hypothetical protein